MSHIDRLGNDMSDDIQDALAAEWEAEGNERSYPDDLVGEEEHLRDSEFQGDPRRCPHHPTVVTSSDDGMFDAPCGECEAAMDQWENDPENTTRQFCGTETGPWVKEPRYPTRCLDEVSYNDDLVVPF